MDFGALFIGLFKFSCIEFASSFKFIRFSSPTAIDRIARNAFTCAKAASGRFLEIAISAAVAHKFFLGTTMSSIRLSKISRLGKYSFFLVVERLILRNETQRSEKCKNLLCSTHFSCSEIAPSELEPQFDETSSPQCTYSIRKGSFDGPEVHAAVVGETGKKRKVFNIRLRTVCILEFAFLCLRSYQLF